MIVFRQKNFKQNFESFNFELLDIYDSSEFSFVIDFVDVADKIQDPTWVDVIHIFGYMEIVRGRN